MDVVAQRIELGCSRDPVVVPPPLVLRSGQPGMGISSHSILYTDISEDSVTANNILDLPHLYDRSHSRTQGFPGFWTAHRACMQLG